MLKFLHPLERIGFAGMMASLLLLFILPEFLTKEDNPWIWIFVPILILAVSGVMLLWGQQIRLKAQRAKLEKLLKDIAASTIEIDRHNAEIRAKYSHLRKIRDD